MSDAGDEHAARKAELRAEYRRRRRALGADERARESAAAVAACRRLLAARSARELAAYCALADELDLGDLIASWWAQGRRVWLPRVSGPGELSWHAVSAPDQLRPGAHGIREPDPGRIAAAPLPSGAAILVPGVAFAADGRRLGQGGGFYDRVLARHHGASIGVGFACQRCDDLPRSGHDRAVDAVVLGGEVHARSVDGHPP